MKRLILSTLFLAFVLYCDKQKENQPPSITSVTSSSSTVEINQTITLKVTASDPEGDQLNYKWGSNGGSFPNGISQATVSWQAPNIPGTYKIWITVDDGNNHAVNGDLSIQVVKSQGTLIVNSNPTGATIYLTSTNTGKTTNASFQLDPGMYQIVLQKSHYNDWIGDATVYANQTTTINAVLEAGPSYGFLAIHSTPSGADIYLNNTYTSQRTDTIFALNPGVYSILLKKSGYLDYGTSAAVETDRTTTVNAVLSPVPAKGILLIDSKPTGADIYLNSRFTGFQTNWNFELDPGTYSVLLKKSGYEDWSTNATVNKDQITAISAELVAKPGVIQKIYYATDDAFVLSNSPNDNTGKNLTMTVLLSGSQSWWCLVRFNLNDIPSSATINRAILKIYCDDVIGNNANVEVYRILRNWSETAITWNLMSTGFFDTGRITAELIDSKNAYYNFNIKSLVQNWVSGSYSNYGVLLRTTINNGGARFLTRENASNKPYLDIEYK